MKYKDFENIVDKQKYFVLLYDCIGHPKKSPSIEEINYTNPSVNKEDIRNRLNYLVDKNILTKEESNGFTFYKLTSQSMVKLKKYFRKRHKLDLDTIEREYSNVTKTNTIEEIENIERANSLSN